MYKIVYHDFKRGKIMTSAEWVNTTFPTKPRMVATPNGRYLGYVTKGENTYYIEDDDSGRQLQLRLESFLDFERWLRSGPLNESAASAYLKGMTYHEARRKLDVNALKTIQSTFKKWIDANLQY